MAFNVWKMNLIDNRDEKPANLNHSKFDFCKEKGIIGIGWVGYDSDEQLKDDTSYKKAKNAFLSLKINDLVWVKNPLTQEYFICQIKSLPEYKGAEYKDCDVGYCCKCKYYSIGTAEQLKYGITANDLLCIGTICSISDELKNKSISTYNNMKKKKHIKYTIFVSIVVMLFMAIIASILLSNKSRTERTKIETTKIFNSQEEMFNDIQGVYSLKHSDDYYCVIKEQNVYFFQGKIVEDFVKPYEKKDMTEIDQMNYTDLIDKLEKYVFANPTPVNEIDYKNGRIVLQKSSEGEEYIAIYKYKVMHKDLKDDSEYRLIKINDSPNLNISDLEDRFEKEKAKIIENKKAINNYLPTLTEYAKRLENAYPELKEWSLYNSPDPNETVFAKNGNINDAFLCITKTLLLLKNVDMDLTVTYQYGDITQLIIRSSKMSLESMWDFVDILLGEYPEKIPASQANSIYNNYDKRNVLQKGIEYYKSAGEVEYVLQESTTSNTRNIIVRKIEK